MQYITNFFGQAYGACSYGSSTYQNGTCQTTTTTTGGSSSNSLLTNTGFDILLIVTIACFLAFVALLVRFWKRPKKQPPVSAPEQHPVETGVQDDSQGDTEQKQGQQ
jgi:hypothetical protein